MSLTFSNFKQIIPAQILTRGRDYVRQGNILDLTFDEEEWVWEAQVAGTEVYDVRIEQTANGSLTCDCTCPYDMGEHCKHIAAVLYAIEEAFPEQIGSKPRKKSANRQTRHDKLRQRLETVSRERLVSILLDLTQHDRELLNQLLIHLDTGGAKPMDYRRVVKDALRVGRGEYGFDYMGSNRAGRQLEKLLAQAEQWRKPGEADRAVGMYQAVIDETTPIIDYADDSDGSLGAAISFAIEGLAESAALLDEAGRDALFTFCLDRVRRKEARGWDWRWELLEVAENMVDNPNRRALFLSALEDIEADVGNSGEDRFFSSYSLEMVALSKLALIERFDDKAAAREFLREHAHLDRLRMELIERCIAEDAVEEAMQHIQAGITSSQQQGFPGLTSQYRALQLKLLQQTGDTAAVVKAARALWIEGGDESHFDVLRKTVPKSEWQAFVETLIKDIRHRPEQLAWLYARENRWRDLLTLVQTDRQGKWLLLEYRVPLESRFPQEVSSLYEETVETVLVSATGRDEYRKAIDLIRRMKALGQAERADALVQRIRATYPRRRALLEELNQL